MHGNSRGKACEESAATRSDMTQRKRRACMRTAGHASRRGVHGRKAACMHGFWSFGCSSDGCGTTDPPRGIGRPTASAALCPYSLLLLTISNLNPFAERIAVSALFHPSFLQSRFTTYSFSTVDTQEVSLMRQISSFSSFFSLRNICGYRKASRWIPSSKPVASFLYYFFSSMYL
jgi:hypothetical protein